MKTPVSLLERLQSSPNQETWSRFVLLYLPLICYWGREAGLQDSDVADLSQEVFTLLLHRTWPISLRKYLPFCCTSSPSFATIATGAFAAGSGRSRATN
jgi:hypothetical protein